MALGLDYLDDVERTISNLKRLGYSTVGQAIDDLVRFREHSTVRIPENADEAVTMGLVAMNWLSSHAPERLTALHVSAHRETRIKAIEDCAREIMTMGGDNAEFHACGIRRRVQP